MTERERERVVRTPLTAITKPSQHKGDLTKVDKYVVRDLTRIFDQGHDAVPRNQSRKSATPA